jgi:CRP/FNR family transcriptional regulator, anaerobic regulatory protein
METVLHYLNSIQPLSDELKDYLIKTLRSKEILRRDYLLKAGQISKHIYFIEQGLLRCYYLKDDLEVSSWFMKEGDVIISVESFFKQKESTEYIQALEDAILHYISYNELQYIYSRFPEFNYIGRTLVEHYYTISEQRLHSLRMQRAQERYASLISNNPELIQRIPSKYLASYLGISEETLSRIRSGKKY